jgi:ABC-type multidrug transport system ATPase subunit
LKVTTRLPGYAAPPEDLPSFLTLRQCMQIHAAAYGLGVVPEASEVLCRDLGLAPHLEKLVAAVSLGTRQKLSIALALMNAPSLLLLDEVFNGLDISSALVLKRHLRDLVHDRGMSILLATHALDVVAGCCDGVLLLDSGRLVRQWDAAALAQLRNPGELELALAAALADQPNRPVM